MKAVDTTTCRKLQGRAEEGNTCLQTPGTCESCPLWWQLGTAQKAALKGEHERSDTGGRVGL